MPTLNIIPRGFMKATKRYVSETREGSVAAFAKCPKDPP